MDPGTMALIASVGAPLVGSLFGGKEGHQKIPIKSKGQQKQLNTGLNQWQQLAGGGYENAIGLLQSLLDPNSETYKGFAAPYMQEFEQQVLPGIKEHFAGLNPMGGGMGSSGFAQALGGAGAGLQATLAKLRESLRMQGAEGILQQYNKGFGQGQAAEPYAFGPRSPGTAQSALPGIQQGLASYASNYALSQGFNSRDQGRGYQAPSLTQQLDTLYRSGQMPYV